MQSDVRAGKLEKMCCSDMEDKYVKKLERMGTQGSGPARTFNELKDYKPEVNRWELEMTGEVEKARFFAV